MKIKTNAPDRFDLVIMVAIAILIVVIGLILLRGDQVGLGVQNYSPRDEGGSTTAIQVTFDEPVDPTSQFSIDPPVPGQFSVVNRQVIFQPSVALNQGQPYKITLLSGLKATSGRELKRPFVWQFTVRSPRIAYLAPVDERVQNLYIADPAKPESAQQLTFSDIGINGFDISPDGSKIIYSELEGIHGESSLFAWEMSTGKAASLYACPDAACNSPLWRPTGGMLAFERVDLNSKTGIGPGISRVWLLDFTSNSARPIFKDTQKFGYMPRWSADGSKIAVYNGDAGGIIIHDFAAEQDKIIQTTQGENGRFSPNGKWFFFPKIVEISPGESATHLVMVDLSSAFYVQRDLLPDSDPVNDVDALWLPDSSGLIIARRAPYAKGNSQGAQLFRVELATGAATQITNDENYTNDEMSLSPDGKMFVFRRFELLKAGARPEIWLYNLVTGELKLLINNATQSRWLP